MHSATIIFPNEMVTAEAVAFFRVKLGLNYNISYFSNSSLLFAGNVPYSFTRLDLYKLFEPYGEILRCLVVYSEQTGKSKGYGFVEYTTEEEALGAKFALAKKRLHRRKLRVDFASMRMITYPDVHSRTLFVDCLPKALTSDAALFQYFSSFGTVKFCQVSGRCCEAMLYFPTHIISMYGRRRSYQKAIMKGEIGEAFKGLAQGQT